MVNFKKFVFNTIKVRSETRGLEISHFNLSRTIRLWRTKPYLKKSKCAENDDS